LLPFARETKSALSASWVVFYAFLGITSPASSRMQTCVSRLFRSMPKYSVAGPHCLQRWPTSCGALLPRGAGPAASSHQRRSRAVASTLPALSPPPSLPLPPPQAIVLAMRGLHNMGSADPPRVSGRPRLAASRRERRRARRAGPSTRADRGPDVTFVINESRSRGFPPAGIVHEAVAGAESHAWQGSAHPRRSPRVIYVTTSPPRC
jgi:hypothetical protein